MDNRKWQDDCKYLADTLSEANGLATAIEILSTAKNNRVRSE